jgi:hypothetical protein
LHLVRADVGTHRLSAGLLAGSPVGMCTTEQLEDAKAYLELQLERMVGLDDDAACISLNRDIKAINEERARRWNCLVAS